jgi:hypothetical protein
MGSATSTATSPTAKQRAQLDISLTGVEVKAICES